MSAGRTTARGYGWAHQVARARAKRLVDAGLANCTRCGGPISPFEKWDLDHLDHPDANASASTAAHHMQHATAAPHEADTNISTPQQKRWRSSTRRGPHECAFRATTSTAEKLQRKRSRVFS